MNLPLQPSRRLGFALPAALLLALSLLGAQLVDIRLWAKPNVPPASAAPAVALREGFAFQLRDLPVRHQGGNTLGVDVRYTYVPGIREADYPDFRLLAQTCEEFLSHYPRESAFWEIVNRELTQTLLDRFPALADVTVELHVSANSRIPYGRTSTVTRRRDTASTEGS